MTISPTLGRASDASSNFPSDFSFCERDSDEERQPLSLWAKLFGQAQPPVTKPESEPDLTTTKTSSVVAVERRVQVKEATFRIDLSELQDLEILSPWEGQLITSREDVLKYDWFETAFKKAYVGSGMPVVIVVEDDESLLYHYHTSLGVKAVSPKWLYDWHFQELPVGTPADFEIRIWSEAKKCFIVINDVESEQETIEVPRYFLSAVSSKKHSPVTFNVGLRLADSKLLSHAPIFTDQVMVITKKDKQGVMR